MNTGASTGPRKRCYNKIAKSLFSCMSWLLGILHQGPVPTLNCQKRVTEIELEAVIDQDASREDNLTRLSEQFFNRSIN